jgi:hypothetical protein
MRLIPGIIIAVLFLLALAFLFVSIRKREPKNFYVLGEQLARAMEVEQQRKSRGETGKSPMPDGKYDFWRGETYLINPAPSALDAPLRELCQSFAKSGAESRAKTRASISMDEFYTLLTFSQRAAVFGIRERNAAWLVDGLTALSMIELDRVDFRDVFVSVSLLHHSAVRIGQDANQLLSGAAALSEPKVSGLISNFINRPPEEKVLRANWGYDEVETRNGIGFIGWEFQDYNPTYDLKKIAVDLAEYIAADKYQPVSVSIATGLPDIWLKTKDSASLDKSLRAVRGGATVNGRLRPNEHPDHESQMFTIFLVEVADESAAKTLLELSKKKNPTDYCMLGLAERNLFCLVVARSFVAGKNAFETSGSLARFSNGIAGILRRHAGKG